MAEEVGKQMEVLGKVIDEEIDAGRCQCLGITKKRKERCRRIVRNLKRCWQHVEGEEKADREAKKRKTEEEAS